MSVHRSHPVFNVQTAHRGGCGHQHSTIDQARNCVRNLVQRFRTAPWFEIHRTTLRGSDQEMTGDGTIVANYYRVDICTECAGSLVLGEGREFGHRTTCPLVNN